MNMLRRRLWLSLREASQVSGIPLSTLRMQCSEGRRRCRKIGKGSGRWQVPAKDFAEYERG